jgi:hypothetical protein
MVLPPGKMYRPTGINVDESSNSIDVAEQFNHRISKWTYTDTNFDFTLDSSWGSNGDGTSGEGGPIGDGGPTDNSLYRPTGIVFDGTRLIVTDTFHNRIRTLSLATGEFIDSVGQGGNGISDFYHPAGIDATPTEFVVADELNHRAIKYTTGDTPSNPTILAAPTPLPFNRPYGVFFDIANSFYNVTDRFHGVINRYNTAATAFIAQYGKPGTSGIDLFFPGNGSGEVVGQNSTAFADTRNNALKTGATSTIANLTGTTAGTGDGQLYYPDAVISFLDSATNYVLAANTLNHRIEAFSNTGNALTFQSNFGSP